jgi:cytochrome c oxidase subunit 3
MGIEAVSFMGLPLYNTFILLCSGVTITIGHHALVNGNRSLTIFGFLLSVLLILIFVILQTMEYSFAPFTISDGVYGSVFYSLTGLHGIHMVMLLIMLSFALYKVLNYDFTKTSHVFAEASILYLHILDVL